MTIDRCLGHAYAKVAFPLFRWLSSVNPLVLYYHIVSDQKVPHIDSLYTFRNVSQFKRDLETLLRFYRPLSLQDFLQALRDDRPAPKNSLVLTFDDGVRECHEVVAPILEKMGIPATFFLCSAFVDNSDIAYDFAKSVLASELSRHQLREGQLVLLRRLLAEVGIHSMNLSEAVLSVDYRRKQVLDQIAALLDFDLSAYLEKVQPYLTSEQVRDLLRMGHAIGAHSIDHPRYGDIPLNEQVRQTLESIRFVKHRFAVNYGALAFPSSDANISKSFFQQVLGSGEVDVCFGNHGLLDDCVSRNIQRTSMEKTSLPAEAILGKSYARRFAKMAMGRLKIDRSQ